MIIFRARNIQVKIAFDYKLREAEVKCVLIFYALSDHEYISFKIEMEQIGQEERPKEYNL